ncbi:MAG: DEAD/DEAH box helicase [Candidatus Sericytochromatia bacterium]|nr:DEAD/DEAH box helicase [Candidatus Sericytochromatia bacterium]
MTQNFEDFALHPALLARLTEREMPAPTEVQAQVIPTMLEGRDLLVHAGPHSGETLAYGLPLLSMYDPQARVQALVLVPSAERAQRVYQRLAPLAQGILKIAALYETGGQQEQAIRRGVDILVGTPFLIKDLFAIKQLDLNTVRTLVLDGADRLMTTIQRRDVEYLMDRLPRLDQTALFFWNITEGVEAMAPQLRNPVRIRVAERPAPNALPEPSAPAPAAPSAVAPARTSRRGAPEVSTRLPEKAPPAETTAEPVTLSHRYARITTEQRTDFLLQAIEHDAPARALILARNKHEARRLVQRLERWGRANVDSFNADTSAAQRQAALKRFLAGELKFLVVPEPATEGVDLGAPPALYLTGVAANVALYRRYAEAAEAAKLNFQSLSLVTPEAQTVFSENQKSLPFSRHPLDPGPDEQTIPAVATATEEATGAPGKRTRGRTGATKQPKGAATLLNESMRESRAATGPLAPLPRMMTMWQTFKVALPSGQRPTRDAFHGWLSTTTGIARSALRSIQFHRDHATVDVDERQVTRFQETLKGHLLG